MKNSSFLGALFFTQPRQVKKKKKHCSQLQLETLEARDIPAVWQSVGTGPFIDGGTAIVAPSIDSDGKVYAHPTTGAIQTILTHPNDPGTAWVGTVNGGIWKTNNLDNAGFFPDWVSTTDHLPSLSIGALEFDRADPKYNTLVAGFGKFSSFGNVGGNNVGMLRSFDQGSSWSIVDGGGALRGLNIGGVYGCGNILLAGVSGNDAGDPGKNGLWRSDNNGVSFTNVTTQSFGGPGKIFQMISAPGFGSNDIFVALASPGDTNTSGIFQSQNRGESWVKISDSTLDSLFSSEKTDNIRIAVNESPGNGTTVYCAVSVFGKLGGGKEVGFEIGDGVIFRRNPGDGVWSKSDPLNLVSNQGEIHLALAADPVSPFLVYAGGQSNSEGEPFQSLANIFRIDFTPQGQGGPPSNNNNKLQIQKIFGDSQTLSTVASDPIVYSHPIGANGTVPHPDSRFMAFDSIGRLLHACDGGIFGITNPQDSATGKIGKWFSLNGNIKVMEAHSVAFDELNGVFLTGNQDNDNAFERNDGVFQLYNVGDGGRVAAGTAIENAEEISVRYDSVQLFGKFTRYKFSDKNTFIEKTNPSFSLSSGGSDNFPFVTPLSLNPFDANRLLIGSNDHVYETLNGGNDVSRLDDQVGGIGVVTALAYGGRIKAGNQFENYPDVLYASAFKSKIDPALYIRKSASDPFTKTNTFPGSISSGQEIRDISLDPYDWRHAVIITNDGVYETKTAGDQNDWNDLSTASLNAAMPISAKGFMAVALTPIQSENGTGGYAVFVGGPGGVYALDSRKPGIWMKTGPYIEDNLQVTPPFDRTGLPNVVVSQFTYNLNKDILGMGTLGRGPWFTDKVSTAYFDNRPPINAGPTATIHLPGIANTAVNPKGEFVYNLFGKQGSPNLPKYADPDGDQFAGIAITGNDSFYDQVTGRWQYSVDAGFTWYEVPTGTEISEEKALVLRASDKLRYLPVAKQTGDPGKLSVRFWDGKFGDFTLYDAKTQANLAMKDIRPLSGFSFSNTTNQIVLDTSITIPPIQSNSQRSRVTTYDRDTGKANGTTEPFPGFKGEVRVAQGDLNGDGIFETVAAAGPGGGPAVNILDSQTGQSIASFFAYDQEFTGGVFVQLSDINNDGVTDIITGAGSGGGPHVKVFNGADLREIASFFAYDPKFLGGVTVGTADINGDNILDIVTGAGPGGGPHVKVFDGTNLSLIREWFAFSKDFSGGVFVAVGDLGNDGQMDLVIGAGTGGGPVVAVFNPLTGDLQKQFFAYDLLFTGGVRVAVGDANGDGSFDLITGAGPGGSPHVKVFHYPDLNLLSEFFTGPLEDNSGVFIA